VGLWDSRHKFPDRIWNCTILYLTELYRLYKYQLELSIYQLSMDWVNKTSVVLTLRKSGYDDDY